MKDRTIQTDVVVVGGGPIGMTMALLLQYLNVDFRLIEKEDSITNRVQLSTFGHRSMEIFRRIGLAENIRHNGWPDEQSLDVSFCTAVGGYELMRLERGTAATRPQPDFSPENETMCPGHRVTPILLAALKQRCPDALHFETCFSGLTNTSDGVELEAIQKGGDGKITFKARYVVACDGHNSSVRQHCGVSFDQVYPTENYQSIIFEAPYLADLMKKTGSDCMFYKIIRPDGKQSNLRHLDGKGLYRLIIELEDGVKKEPYSELAQTILVDTPMYVRESHRWRLGNAVAASYRHQNVFFAGDAAHVLAPAGGYGINTGIGDTENLAWKLAFVLNGRATDALLDSYNAERRAVAMKALEIAHGHIVRLRGSPVPEGLQDPGDLGVEIRKNYNATLIEQQAPREFNSPDVHLGSFYSSEVIAPGPPPQGPGAWQQRCYNGVRAPHFSVHDKRSVLDYFGKTFVLLCFGDDPALEARIKEAPYPLELVRLPLSSSNGIYEKRLVLVRPDGFVAWQGDELEEGVMEMVVGGWRRQLPITVLG